MSELDLQGVRYRTSRLSTIQQWEIFRRLGPVIPVLSSEYRDGVTPTPGARWVMAGSMGALADLKQVDSDYVLQSCLAAVERYDQAAQRWSRMSAGGRLMYEDTDLDVLLELMDVVLQESLGPFFSRLRSASGEAEQNPTTS